MLTSLVEQGFDILALHHAEAILNHDMPEALSELETVLGGLSLPIEELVRGGGGEGQLTQRIRKAFEEHLWHKHNFEIKKIVDGQEKESISHEIDHVRYTEKGVFALEIEWNNKDPFFDRDLENFKRLHADGVISIGCIITRGKSLQASLRNNITRFAKARNLTDTNSLRDYYRPTQRQRERIDQAARNANSFEEGWAHVFVADKFGQATTHWEKLEVRVRRGVGNPCPLLLIGLPDSILKM